MAGGRIISGERPIIRPKPESFPAKSPAVDELFGKVQGFISEKRAHHEELLSAERSIFASYEAFSPAERVAFFSVLYDRFAERYDRHMGQETGHFAAICELMRFAMPHIRKPILDITAGTGEPLLYALDALDWSSKIRSTVGGGRFSGFLCNGGYDGAYANEVSPMMLAKAQKKLTDRGVTFINKSAYELALDGMETVLCSQTFHLIADEDKAMLVKAIHRALSKGGKAIVMEEDPFRYLSDAFNRGGQHVPESGCETDKNSNTNCILRKRWFH